MILLQPGLLVYYAFYCGFPSSSIQSTIFVSTLFYQISFRSSLFFSSFFIQRVILKEDIDISAKGCPISGLRVMVLWWRFGPDLATTVLHPPEPYPHILGKGVVIRLIKIDQKLIKIDGPDLANTILYPPTPYSRIHASYKYVVIR